MIFYLPTVMPPKELTLERGRRRNLENSHAAPWQRRILESEDGNLNHPESELIKIAL
jgi:hypothetical protein